MNTTTAKVATGTELFPTITVVGTRALEAEQAWFQGEGRGYTREFIKTQGVRYCEACDETHDLNAFPTFSVPRQNGETRGRVCRTQVKAARKANAEKAARVARAKKAAAASAVARSAKAAARKRSLANQA